MERKNISLGVSVRMTELKTVDGGKVVLCLKRRIMV